MKEIQVFLPFKGGSIYGFGKVWKLEPPFSKYVFENSSGSILFSSVTDMQVKGITMVKELLDEDLLKLGEDEV